MLGVNTFYTTPLQPRTFLGTSYYFIFSSSPNMKCFQLKCHCHNWVGVKLILFEVEAICHRATSAEASGASRHRFWHKSNWAAPYFLIWRLPEWSGALWLYLAGGYTKKHSNHYELLASFGYYDSGMQEFLTRFAHLDEFFIGRFYCLGPAYIRIILK